MVKVGNTARVRARVQCEGLDAPLPSLDNRCSSITLSFDLLDLRLWSEVRVRVRVRSYNSASRRVTRQDESRRQIGFRL